MVNEWVRADRLQPEYGQRVLMSVKGLGMRTGRYDKKVCVDGGYFQWQENAEIDYVEDDLSLIAWRDLPEDYDWGCE